MTTVSIPRPVNAGGQRHGESGCRGGEETAELRPWPANQVAAAGTER